MTRCVHGFRKKLCVVKSCANWDGRDDHEPTFNADKRGERRKREFQKLNDARKAHR